MNQLNHVAFIMDGNGRWGKKKRKTRNYGHFNGVKTVKKVVEASIKLNIPTITFFVFSTENWKRPSSEINYLFKILSIYIDKEIKNLKKRNIKIKIIGNLKPFPKNLKLKLYNVQSSTKYNKKIQINMALNYGSREEIITTVNKLIKKKIVINEKNISKYLYTGEIPDPEILIRTGNTYRISNFLSWQCIYSEIFFVKKMWPDFNENDFNRIILKFKNINRNFGGLHD